MKRSATLLLCGVLLAGCGTPQAKRYTGAEVGRPIETATGTVVSSQVVNVAGETSLAGPGAGAALAGASTGLVTGSGWAAIIGAVIGAGAGYLAQEAINDRQGIEYVLKMSDGRTVTLVQNRQSGEQPIANGTPVLVQYGGEYSRVMVDPSGGRQPSPPPASSPSPSGGWSDPDKPPVWPAPAPAAGGSGGGYPY